VAIAALADGCGWARTLRERRPPFRRVRPGVAFEMMRDNRDSLLVLDLRTAREFQGPLGHVNGAKNIPLAELPFRLAELASYRDTTFIVYCRADDCGPEGMAVLVSSGYEDAVLMDGGIEAWVQDGFGTVDVNPPVVAGDPQRPVGDEGLAVGEQPAGASGGPGAEPAEPGAVPVPAEQGPAAPPPEPSSDSLERDGSDLPEEGPVEPPEDMQPQQPPPPTPRRGSRSS
jgi:rhodanese-related sulfurtransferase